LLPISTEVSYFKIFIFFVDYNSASSSTRVWLLHQTTSHHKFVDHVYRDYGTDFESHMKLCRSHKSQKTNIRNSGGNWLRFSYSSANELVPFTFIADFGCTIVKLIDSLFKETINLSGYSWACIDYTGKK